MNRSMTASELQAWLRERFPVENERHEWKAWRSLKSSVSGRKGEDLVSYVSALANMDGGCVVIGAQDKTLAVTGIEDFSDYTPENVIHRVLGKAPGLPSMGLRVEVMQTSDTGAVVWLVHVPRHAPRQPVQAHDKAWQRDGDSLVELHQDRLDAILVEPLANHDWSAVVVPRASITDLDPQALALARQKFADRNATKPWFKDIAGWSNTAFLDKARLTINGGITRTALLLLGRTECVHLLSPHVAEISWKLPEERAVEHFGPPFLLTTTEVLKRIRNPNIKLFPATRLLAEEMPKYDTRVILEALHNCVAHQDYERCARIVVEERRGHVVFQNAGGFFDGQPEQYLAGDRMPGRYRNKFLTAAMVELDMIDTAGFGIHEMFSTQRRRFLPLPDYEQSNAQNVVLKIYGQAIDENYTRLLMERSDLPLEHVLWLDRIQKKLKVDHAQVAELRKARLIEGRKPNFYVSAKVADLTNTRAQYSKNKGLDDTFYRKLVIEHIARFGQSTGAELRLLLLSKLPDSLDFEQKINKVRNLLTALRRHGHDGRFIVCSGKGPKAFWQLTPLDE